MIEHRGYLGEARRARRRALWHGAFGLILLVVILGLWLGFSLRGVRP